MANNTKICGTHTTPPLPYTPVEEDREIIFNHCLIRNKEMDNTLDLSSSTKLEVTSTTEFTVVVDNLPNYIGFDESGWIAMLSDDFNTGTIDPSITGDYWYRDACTIDRNTKTLTFATASFPVVCVAGYNLVLYNPFLNYSFVGDQQVRPLFDRTGAPYWRSAYSAAGPMFKHSTGYYVWFFNGHNGVSYTIGYAKSWDMNNWSMQNGDLPIITVNDIPDLPDGGYTLYSMGSVQQVNDETNRYYIPLFIGSSIYENSGVKLMYFDEDLTQITFSEDLIVFEGLPVEGVLNYFSVVKIGDYYHALTGVFPVSLYDRYITAGKSLSLEGPYTVYQDVVVKGSPEANDGVCWSGLADCSSIFNDGTKTFGLFGGQAIYSQSGTKGNREFCLLDFDENLETWTPNKASPVIINPTYFQNIYSLPNNYAWSGDHLGANIGFLKDGNDFYMSCAMRYSTYQATIIKLTNQLNALPTPV